MAESNPAPTTVEQVVPPGTPLGPVDLSVVVPALNEAVPVGEFVDWCQEGLKRAGVTGQILIVDSSTDETPQIALAHGAEVLRVPKCGLGRAYIDAIPYVRGRWIVMGDADLTYDFRELAAFVEQFRRGAEFILGSRFHGSIEDGAMPPLHRYFGTPLTTWILNRIYGSSYSDIHCGMRGITRDALAKISLKSQSWEYASEMVLKAARLRLRTAEVPVKFYKDRAGRVSHHRRMGWRSPWVAGWINLKVMLVYSPDSFLLLPGVGLLALGAVLSLCLATGPIMVAGVQLNLYSMLLGLVSTVLGYSCVHLGMLARVLHHMRPGRTERWLAFFSYNRGVGLGLLAGAAGVCLLLPLCWEFFTQGFRLQKLSHLAILGLLLIILGFLTFVFTLILEMTKRVVTTPSHD